MTDEKLKIDLLETDGAPRHVVVCKGEYEELGLEFESYLMDKQHHCKNKCIFCFVDQMPPGMRETLYFKDDDARLSFLMGNYITLTNLSRREIDRICELRISPINISVHATDPALREALLKHRRAGECLDIMGRFAAAGIEMNCQIVSCPGVNDGPALERTLADLGALHPAVESVAGVPGGPAKFREGVLRGRPHPPRRRQHPAGRQERQQHPAGRPPAHRPPPHHLEALHGHERPPAALYRGRPGGQGQRHPPGGRL